MKRLLAFILLGLLGFDAAAEILIGTAGPMRGARAWAGEQFRRGAGLAVDDVNRAGGVLGRTVRLLVGDDAQDPEQAEALARRFVSDGVVFVAGHRTSDASIAASGIYVEAGVVMISPSATSPALTDRGIPGVFRVCGRDDWQGVVAGDHLADRWAGRDIAVVHDGTLYGRGLAEQTRRRLNRRGVSERLFLTYRPGSVDFTGLVDRFALDGIDVVYVGGYSTDAGLILRQIRERGLDIAIIGGDSLHNVDFWMIGGAAGEGTRFTFDADPRERPAAADVVARYRAEGYEPEGYTLHAYAAVQIWAAAADRAGTLDAGAISAEIRRGRFETVLGDMEFDERGDPTVHAYVWYVWRGGRYVRER